MNNEEYFEKLKDLSEYGPFLNTINISDKNLDEQYDKELISRFLVLRGVDPSALSSVKDLGIYLDDKLVEYFQLYNDTWTATDELFKRTFRLIDDTVGDDAFKRYNLNTNVFYGGFIVSAFEMVAIGIANNIDHWEAHRSEIGEKIVECWQKIYDENITWKGYSAAGRLPKTIAVGQEVFR